MAIQTKKDMDRNTDTWSPQEDQRLRHMVRTYGAKMWEIISKSIPGRSDKSCQSRWATVKDRGDSTLKRNSSTEEESNEHSSKRSRTSGSNVAIWGFFPTPSDPSGSNDVNGSSLRLTSSSHLYKAVSVSVSVEPSPPPSIETSPLAAVNCTPNWLTLSLPDVAWRNETKGVFPSSIGTTLLAIKGPPNWLSLSLPVPEDADCNESTGSVVFSVDSVFAKEPTPSSSSPYPQLSSNGCLVELSNLDLIGKLSE